MSISITLLPAEHVFACSENNRFFDTLALLGWRHSSAVQANVREAKGAQHTPHRVEVASTQSDFDFLVSMRHEIDFLATTATETIGLGKTTSVDTYLQLFQRAAEGRVLNTSHQINLFFDHIGINDARLTDDARGQTTNLALIDGNHRCLALRQILTFWREIGEEFRDAREFSSESEFLSAVRVKFSIWLQDHARFLIVYQFSVWNSAPSTHEWVHGFVLWTGISPPAEVSETDAIRARNAQRPNSVEDYRDFLCRQDDRPGRARNRHARRSERNSNAGCSANPYFVGSRNFGRGAFRRSWANCQDASHQAA
jgi:hypothetical protein